MSIRRVVPDVASSKPDDSRAFYIDVLGFEMAMDLGWIMTFVSPINPTAQISVVRADATASVVPSFSIEVDNVDRVYEKTVARGLEIVHPLTTEPWGVRRFFVRDPNGVVINVLSHVDPSSA